MTGVSAPPRTRDPEEVAAVLLEALPYLRRFQHKVVVVKFGGAALAADDADGDPLASFGADVALLRSVGVAPVVVHGGGPQIATELARRGLASSFVDGLRVTDAATLDVVRMVLVGKVNSELVGAINAHGPLAVGVSGLDAHLLRVTQSDTKLGYVGDVELVDPTLLCSLLERGLVPVIATMGADAAGQAYNVNADTAAGAIAVALCAEKLVVLSDVAGVRLDPGDPSTALARVTADELAELVSAGVAKGGMLPKARAALDAVRRGVGAAHLLDGTMRHALLLELLTDLGVGTMVTP